MGKEEAVMSHGTNPPATGLSYLPADTSAPVLEVTVGEALRRASAEQPGRTALWRRSRTAEGGGGAIRIC